MRVLPGVALRLVEYTSSSSRWRSWWWRWSGDIIRDRKVSKNRRGS
jgi:hypothetical protein